MIRVGSSVPGMDLTNVALGSCEVCYLNRHDRCNGYLWNMYTGIQRCACVHRRNRFCMKCGDTRGGPFGHESDECQWRPRPEPQPDGDV